MDIAVQNVIRFGNFEFQKDVEQLICNGEKVELQLKPAAILGLLLESPGALVTRAEIVKAIWPDRTVDYDQRIATSIKQIRKALGDDPANPVFIETVPRKGYRFVAPIIVDASGTTTPEKTNQLFIVGAAALLLIAIGVAFYALAPRSPAEEESKTILAVLPVRFVSSDGREEFPADGITHAIIARLIEDRPDKLAVIGRTSMQKYKNLDPSLEQIDQELGAEMVLETTFRSTENLNGGYEASVSLVETTTGQVRWSAVENGTLRKIEDEIVASLLMEFGASQALPQINNDYATVEPNAYDAFIAGLHIEAEGKQGSTRKSLEYFQKAIAHSPNFWRAHIGIARASTRLGLPKSEIMSSLDQALAINPAAAEAYYLKAISAFYTDWDFEGAEFNYKRAIELRPGQPMFHVMYSNLLRSIRRFDEAAKHGDIALKLDPLSEIAVGDYEWQFLSQGNYQQAIRFCERALTLRLEYRAREYNCLMLANFELGRFTAAAEYAMKLVEEDESDENTLSKIRTLLGKERVQAVWRLEIEKTTANEKAFSRHFTIARAYVSLGDFEKGLDALEQSIDAHENGVVYIAQDPTFVKLANEPRYQRALERVGLPKVPIEAANDI